MPTEVANVGDCRTYPPVLWSFEFIFRFEAFAKFRAQMRFATFRKNWQMALVAVATIVKL